MKAEIEAFWEQGVPLDEAAPETLAWRNFITGIIQPGHDNRVDGYFIPVDDIMNILNSCDEISGVRAYFALRPEEGSAQGRIHLYIVPVDAHGNDILEVDGGASVIYDTTKPCPPLCGEPNPLNGGTE